MQPAAPQTPVIVLRSGIENLEPDCWVVSVFDALGCFSSGKTEAEAVALAGRRVHQYFEWLAKKDGNPAPFEESVHVEIVERIETYPWPKDPALPVHAFFEEDTRPLRLWDLDMAQRLLEWSRQDFLYLSGSLLPDSTVSMENDLGWKSLDELMGHLWETENAILKHFGAPAQMAGMPSDSIGRLQMVRAKFLETLPQWSEAEILVEEFGEKWSPRKALRRVLWHERDHIWELEKFVHKDW